MNWNITDVCRLHIATIAQHAHTYDLSTILTHRFNDLTHRASRREQILYDQDSSASNEFVIATTEEEFFIDAIITFLGKYSQRLASSAVDVKIVCNPLRENDASQDRANDNINLVG